MCHNGHVCINLHTIYPLHKIKNLTFFQEMDKPTSAKSKGSSAGSRNRNLSPKSRSSSGKKKSSPSPSRKSGDDLKSALRKGSGDKKRKKTIVKSPDLTEDGLKIVDMSGQGMTIVPLHIINCKHKFCILL